MKVLNSPHHRAQGDSDDQTGISIVQSEIAQKVAASKNSCLTTLRMLSSDRHCRILSPLSDSLSPLVVHRVGAHATCLAMCYQTRLSRRERLCHASERRAASGHAFVLCEHPIAFFVIALVARGDRDRPCAQGSRWSHVHHRVMIHGILLPSLSISIGGHFTMPSRTARTTFRTTARRLAGGRRTHDRGRRSHPRSH
jgi:hypothetical protein